MGKKRRRRLITGSTAGFSADVNKARTRAHCVTPPKLLSTTKAVILSFISPVLGSLMGVLANTVKISARPPLLTGENVYHISKTHKHLLHVSKGTLRDDATLW